MSIVLQSSGGGQITIQEPATASNFTQTLPAATGTVAVLDGSNNLSVAGNLSFNSGYGSAAVAYGCRAWVNFDGTGTVSIRASGNVSSITDIGGNGAYTVNLTTAMPDANYGVAGTGGGTSNGYQLNKRPGTPPTTSAFGIIVGIPGLSDNDDSNINVMVFR